MIESSSSDSELGERVRNVSKLLIKSTNNEDEQFEDQAYKRKLGDLIFDASFEGGNLGSVEQIDQYEYDLMLRPDVMNSRFRLWFNFTVSNQRPNQCVIFTIVNLSDKINLFHEGLTPVVRTRKKPNWIRLHGDQVFYYKSIKHSNRLVLSIAFKFCTYQDEHQFALTYPYGYTRLCNFINRWQIELKRRSLRSGGSINASSRNSNRSNLSKRRIFRRGRTPDVLSMGRNSNSSLKQPDRSSSAMGFLSSSRVASSRANTRDYEHLDDDDSCDDQEEVEEDDKEDLAKLNTKSLCKSILAKHVYQLSISSSSAGDLTHLAFGGIEQSREPFLTKRWVTSPAFIPYSGGEMPKVVVFCRSYGNLDGPAQLVCQGIIDFLLLPRGGKSFNRKRRVDSEFLASKHIASAARKFIHFDFYPMLNPDSNFVGNSQSDLLGQSSVTIEKSLSFGEQAGIYKNFKLFYKNLLNAASSMRNKQRLIVIELRTNYNLIGSRILGYHQNPFDSLAMERHLALARLLSRFTSDFYLEYCAFSRNKPNCSPSYFEFNLAAAPEVRASSCVVDQYVLEVSPFGYFKRSLLERKYELYDELKYLRLGKAIVYALVELLVQSGQQHEDRARSMGLRYQKQKQKQQQQLASNPTTSKRVTAILDSFAPTSGDIDDLTLRLGAARAS